LAANYFRFYIADILAKKYEAQSFLYLDTDTYISRDMQELFRPPLPLAAMGAQNLDKCSLGKMLLLNDERLKQVGIKEEDACLTASVMLVNITAWTHLHITDSVEHWLAANAASKLWHLGSMPPLMVALHGKWRPLGGDIVGDLKGVNSCSALCESIEKCVVAHPFKLEMFRRKAKEACSNGEAPPCVVDPVPQPDNESLQHGISCLEEKP